jgi:hypothetical protein
MKEKLITRLYDFWGKTDDDKAQLLKEITENVNEGVNGAEVLLDWCRCDYDNVKEQYMKMHNINEDEMEKIMEEHCGDYTFMYEDIPYVSELDNIWDISNWFLDYCNGDMTEEELESWLEV